MGVWAKPAPGTTTNAEGSDERSALIEAGTEDLGEITETNGNGDLDAAGDGKDIVVFSAPSFYVLETDPFVKIDILRIGQLQGHVRCSFYCRDGSACDGIKYKAVAGEVEFADGVDMATVSVPIYGTSDWSATLDFRVHICEPVNCAIGDHLDHCLVKIVDVDKFPSNSLFKHYVPDPAQNNLREYVEEISGTFLCWHYMSLVTRMGNNKLKVFLTILFDQTKTLYVCLQLYLWIYVPDVLFNHEDENDEELFVIIEEDRRTSQLKTAFIVGLLYCLPMFVLMLWDKVKLFMDTKGNVRTYMQCNLFRRYLNYSENSRQRVLPAHMQVAVLKQAQELSQGFVAVLDLFGIFAKILAILYFIKKENPGALKYECVQVGIAFAWILFRYQCMSPPEDVMDRQNEVSDTVDDTCEKYRVIANYYKRPLMNKLFAQKVGEWRNADIREENYEMDTTYLLKWLGPTFIGLYIWQIAPDMLDEKLELGQLLGTIVSFREINEGICEFLEIFNQANKMLEPLREYTVMLNYKTDVEESSQISKRRRAAMRRARKRVNREKGDPTNKMTVDLIDVQYIYPGRTDTVFADARITVQQGTMVGLCGDHGVGKATFLRILAHELKPTRGEVFIPTHLRHLLVSQEVYLVRGSVWTNLTYGTERRQNESEAQTLAMRKRIEAMLRKLGIWSSIKPILDRQGVTTEESFLDDNVDTGKSCLMEIQRWCPCCQGRKQIPFEEDSDWQDTLSYSTKLKIHLARAYLSTAEVLIMQRPLHHFNQQEGLQILEINREYVANRGMCLPASTRETRRPRTLFFSVETPEHAMLSDICIEIMDGGIVAQHNLNSITKLERETLRAHFSKSKTGTSKYTDMCIEEEELKEADAGVKG